MSEFKYKDSDTNVINEKNIEIKAENKSHYEVSKLLKSQMKNSKCSLILYVWI